MTNHEGYTDSPEITPEALRLELGDLKLRLGSFYECPEDLEELGLSLVDSSESVAPRCENGNLVVGYDQVDSLHQELVYMDSGVSEQETYRLMLGVGVAGVIASTQLNRFAADSKHVRYADALKEFFAGHKPIDNTFSSIFKGHLQDRASMTRALSDKQAFSINGLRYRMKLLTDVYKESADYSMLPSARPLADQARKRILDVYNNYSGIYTDVSVIGLGQTPAAGEQIFFQTLPEWLVALACPMRESELTSIHSNGWRID